MDYVRTPDEQFNDLTGYSFEPKYLEYNGLRQHYIDEGSGEVILCLHGEPSWSFLYRKFFPVLSPNYRIIAPDLYGFGKSDKPIKLSDYTYEFHLKSLINFLDELSLYEITIVVQDWGGLLGLGLVGALPERFKRLVIMNTALPVGKPLPFFFKIWKAFAKYHPNLPIGGIVTKGCYRKSSKTKEIKDAYNAPFPSKKYKAGARVFPMLVPSKPNQEGVERMQKAREILAKWEKPCLVMFSDKDPILGSMVHFFKDLVPTAKNQKDIVIKNAGHFLQEDAGEQIAGYIHEFMQGKLLIASDKIGDQ